MDAPAHVEAPAAHNRHYGGFAPIRLVAALGVVYAHSYDLTGNRRHKPTFSIGHQEIRLGRIGVDIFFVISGFLIATSWQRSQSARDYAVKRFARVWPALTCVVLLSVVVIGPIATELTVAQYFGRGATFDYAWHNLTMFFGIRHDLPGVFSSAAQGSVNGSLWTLPYELWGYVVIALLGTIRQLRQGPLLYGLLATTLGLFQLSYNGTIMLDSRVFGMSGRDGVELAAMFLFGAVLSRWSDRLNLRHLFASGVLLIFAAFVIGTPTPYLVGLGCAVIGAGGLHGSAIQTLDRLGDPSYGIYLFSYPIQQILYIYNVARSPAAMVLWSFGLAVAVGYCSWHAIEQPGLRLITRHARRSGSASALASASRRATAR